MNRCEKFKWTLMVPVLEKLLNEVPPLPTAKVPTPDDIARIQARWARSLSDGETR